MRTHVLGAWRSYGLEILRLKTQLDPHGFHAGPIPVGAAAQLTVLAFAPIRWRSTISTPFHPVNSSGTTRFRRMLLGIYPLSPEKRRAA
jgi:hypothetical protein